MDNMAGVDVNKLRKLIFNFYQENDPVALQGGIDIHGILNFAVENGVQALNAMFQRKYGKIIDVNQKVGNAKDQFERTSIGLSMSTKIAKTEQEYRDRLFHYFNKHDADMLKKSREEQFEKFVKFAMLNGMAKLSDKLKQRYGEAVPDADKKNDIEEEIEEPMEYVMSGQNNFGLDLPRLRDDLEMFYIENDDIEQLDVLDEMIDWACQLGIDEFDEKLQQLYGITLNQMLSQKGMPLHQNKVQEVPAAPERPAVPEGTTSGFNDQDDATEYEEREVEEEYLVGEREFDEMTDEEIKAELIEFYQEHDPDNLEKLDDVLNLCRSISREKVNEMLVNIYQVPLTPITIKRTRMVKQRIALPKKPKAKPMYNAPPPPARNDDDAESGWGDEPEAAPVPVPSRPVFSPPTTEPTQNKIPVFKPPVDGGFAPPGFNPADVAAQAAKARKPVEPQGFDFAEPQKKQPSWMDKVNKMQDRIRGGKAKVRDGRGGVVEVNLLIDVCKKYELDPLSGVCKHCGFAKKDHVYMFAFNRR